MSGIKAGDLVMVTKAAACCGFSKHIGLVSPVTAVHFNLDELVCQNCLAPQPGDIATGPDGFEMQAYRLIRIDPPALPESIQDEREVTV